MKILLLAKWLTLAAHNKYSYPEMLLQKRPGHKPDWPLDGSHSRLKPDYGPGLAPKKRPDLQFLHAYSTY
jgi:hypothetical protein